MNLSSKDFALLPRNTKQRIRTLDAMLRAWEERIYREARQANYMLQKRRRDPHDRMVSGAVIVVVSYWAKHVAANDSPVMRGSYNCTIIRDDDPFGSVSGISPNGERKRPTGYFLGPMPCCFLLHDLWESLQQKTEHPPVEELLSIGDIQFDVQIKIQFHEEFDCHPEPEAGALSA